MNEQQQSDKTVHYTVVFSVFATALIGIVNEEFLAGQPGWVRILLMAVMAGVLMFGFIQVLKRLQKPTNPK